MLKFNIRLFLKLAAAPAVFLLGAAALACFTELDRFSIVVFALILTGLYSLINALTESINYIKMICSSYRCKKEVKNES